MSTGETRTANAGQLLVEAARQHPDRTAVIFEDRRLTYRELNDRTNALAAGLAEAGLRAGDRVVIWLRNCPEFVEVMFACWKLGLAIVPMNIRLTRDDVAFHVADCAAAALVYGVEFEAGAEQLDIAHKISVGGGGGSIDYERLAGRPAVAEQAVPLPEETPAWLFYTSGTTGRPKGAVITHRCLVFVTVSWCADLYCLRPEDVALHCAPLSHGAGFHALAAVARAASNVIHARFDPAAALDDIARHRVTATWLVPTQVRMLLDSPALAGADLSSLRSVIYGGSPMYAEDLKEAIRRIGAVFCQLYGQGEVPMTISYLRGEEHRLDRPDQHVLTSAGVARTGMELRIADDRDRPLPPGEVGEVLVRGPAVMVGYWDRPDATDEALRGGWLHTGDLAVVDAEGYLTIVDRKKDLIVTGGENVASVEVEHAIEAHPAVREVAVVGVPDERWGEAVRAYVSLHEGSELNEAELIAWVRERLARFKTPRSVVFLPDLPKGGTGKINKSALRAWRG